MTANRNLKQKQTRRANRLKAAKHAKKLAESRKKTRRLVSFSSLLPFLSSFPLLPASSPSNEAFINMGQWDIFDSPDSDEVEVEMEEVVEEECKWDGLGLEALLSARQWPSAIHMDVVRTQSCPNIDFPSVEEVLADDATELSSDRTDESDRSSRTWTISSSDSSVDDTEIFSDPTEESDKEEEEEDFLRLFTLSSNSSLSRTLSSVSARSLDSSFGHVAPTVEEVVADDDTEIFSDPTNHSDLSSSSTTISTSVSSLADDDTELFSDPSEDSSLRISIGATETSTSDSSVDSDDTEIFSDPTGESDKEAEEEEEWERLDDLRTGADVVSDWASSTTSASASSPSLHFDASDELSASDSALTVFPDDGLRRVFTAIRDSSTQTDPRRDVIVSRLEGVLVELVNILSDMRRL